MTSWFDILQLAKQHKSHQSLAVDNNKNDKTKAPPLLPLQDNMAHYDPSWTHEQKVQEVKRRQSQSFRLCVIA
ncbi:YALIA101S04e07448g1_1 [Yarrowia lipolytica]|nr:YALIA101S04e07448g1_1 [Yarrowia lipolytica]VBB89278.1 Conserved hypothetical protein [Yarrowia lipolytica]